ncbi:hypothetical protein BSZ35_00175 [Salinibacter sp. 10B]|uniref:ATP-dependent helicase n=1 Tax=Salinibacter sp. 10B TaxID=1923971 RepID=UPI000CF3664E|nr:ATP-dependent helicase [Salinibacter sp. 10B]PQJ36805.1 hypothetical protein BSZ35_00175 [Salinibacter sp. 10B]
MATPREKQQEVLDYKGGTMGVSAVPGSGKTWTLTRLAARLVTEKDLDAHQEVLVVTLVNSSVDNFSNRIDNLIEEEGLLPDVGYRVCTLHTLAHEIVRARPDLAGLTEDFHVIDDRRSSEILSDVASSWYTSHRSELTGYLADDIRSHKRKEVLASKLPTQLRYLAQHGIKYAKSLGLSAEELKTELAESGKDFRLAEMIQSIYTSYQQALDVRSAVDFDDLIRHALWVLKTDDELLHRLRDQWPYVLEDEAQDSSKIQERILRALVGEEGNWVRVGDPNQAIYESFTTADPNLLREFVDEADESPKLARSGRSQPSIIKLANGTIWWSKKNHPNREVRGALTKPYVHPTDEDDPQQNPPDRPDRIGFVNRDFQVEEEIDLVARSLKKWTEENPDKTAAILVPTRKVGVQAINYFKEKGVPYTDALLKTTTETRKAAQRIERVIEYLAEPDSATRLAKCYLQWRSSQVEDPNPDAIKSTASRISECDRVEDYIWPQGDRSWLASIESDLSNDELQRLEEFRDKVRYWLDLSGLPIGQLVMALGRDFFSDPDQLALVQKFAGLLRRANSYNQDWGLPELSSELEVIAQNQRKFEGVGGQESEFDPDEHTGEVTISTMHGAKGLEWDRVHLLGVNDYHFPSGGAPGKLLNEKWYIRDDLNLQAETLAQIDALSGENTYSEGTATIEARNEYARERIRLFYVCITRAREELMITTNIGRFENNAPALVFNKMSDFYNEHIDE